MHSTENGKVDWVIPDEASFLTKEARIEVHDYSKVEIRDVSDAAFTILPWTAAISSTIAGLPPRFRMRQEGGNLILRGKPMERVALICASGKYVFSGQIDTQGFTVIKTTTIAPAIYCVEVGTRILGTFSIVR